MSGGQSNSVTGYGSNNTCGVVDAVLSGVGIASYSNGEIVAIAESIFTNGSHAVGQGDGGQAGAVGKLSACFKPSMASAHRVSSSIVLHERFIYGVKSRNMKCGVRMLDLSNDTGGKKVCHQINRLGDQVNSICER